ncbi:MAG: Fic family protein [Candidatus Omnitrophica bacterium]|nr:Fic family protein [Candidatus Omnitrophota bacterium]
MNQLYILEKSKGSFSHKELMDFIHEPESRNDFNKVLLLTTYPVYLYWDKVKYKKFSIDASIEKVWGAIKFMRWLKSSSTVIKTEKAKNFQWYPLLPSLEEFLHTIDLNTGGHLSLTGREIDKKSRMQFISRGIVEEAIASSQLEGANTTRKLAKQFLAEKRKPHTNAEHMILNNYKSMKAIEEETKNKPLTLDLLLELHAMIVKNTVPKSDLFRFRKDDDNIVVQDSSGKFIYHTPPNVDFLEEEMHAFIKFANDSLGEEFIHPVIKAIMLHFWMGYLHPFTDGNGRLARLIFYWYLLRKGYWAFSYLPISTIIKKSPLQYAKAYIYSEQDDLDLTYFIDYNIRKIKLAMKEFERYVDKAAVRNKKMNSRAKTTYNLNDRQIKLLQYYYDNGEEYTTPTMHMNLYQVSKSTAIRDLKELLTNGFVSVQKSRKRACYFATDKIMELFKS